MPGDLVQTYFDTGAFGAKILYGKVIKAGRRTYTVRWESGLTNRIRQSERDGDYGIRTAQDPEDAAQAMRLAVKR